MQAELRGFYFNDAPELDAESFGPDDPENFGLSITVFVGPNDVGGEEMFDFFVCSPRWLAEHPPEKGFWFLRNHLLLTRWDFAVLDRALSDLCAHTHGETWHEVATKLSLGALGVRGPLAAMKEPERLRGDGGGLRSGCHPCVDVEDYLAA